MDEFVYFGPYGYIEEANYNSISNANSAGKSNTDKEQTEEIAKLNEAVEATSEAVAANTENIETLQSDVDEIKNAGYQTEDDVKDAISEVVDGAPEAFDTLKEIADKLSDNDDAVAGLVNSVADAQSAAEAAEAKAEEAIAGLDEKADASVLEETNNAVAALSDTVDAKAEQSDLEAETAAREAADAELQAAIDEIEVPSLAGYATEEWVGEQGFATEDVVDEKIAAIEIPDVDGFATSDSLDAEVARAMAKEDELAVAIAEKASNDDLTAETERATAAEEALQAAIDAIEIPEVDNLATKEEVEAVDAKVDALEIPSIDGLATEEYVDEKVAAIEVPDVTDLATKAEVEAVDAKVDALEIPSVDGFVPKEMEGANGKALIFNEADGGGAKFEHNDGTWSFAGVNDGGENGIAGQIYALKKNAEDKFEGARIDITKDGMFYTVGADSAADRMVDANKIATEGIVEEKIAAIEIPDVDGFATKEEVEAVDAKIDALEIPSIDGLAEATAVTTEIGAAVAIINATDASQDAIIALKADASELANYLTTADAANTYQPKGDYATEDFVSEEVEKVVGAAPENFDTLKELADALADLKVVDVPAVEGEHYTQEEIDAAEEGDDAYGKTVDDWKVEPVEEVSHNMTIGEFVNTTMQEVNEKPQVAALEERVNALENALRRVDANAYQTMMNDLEVLDTLKDANTVTIENGTIGDIVVPETTRSKTINGELETEASVTLTSRYGLTINNTGTEPTNVDITAPAVEGYNAATVTLNGGDYDTVTLTDASLTTNTAATLSNVVITEDTTKAVTINANFADGATVTSYSDAPITLNNKNAEGDEATITLDAPGSTVTLQGGKWEMVTAAVSNDTLIIKKTAKIKDLTVTKGNVIVEVPRQSDIASVITGNIDIAEGYTIDYNKVDVTQDNMSALKGTAECTLQGDITTTTAFVAPLSPAWDTVWNLNGHTMEVNTTGGRGGLMVRYNSSVEFNGPGTFRNNTDYGVWLASTGGTLTINGGTFEAMTHVVYAQQGVITINGGVFKFVDPENEEKDENGNFKFLLNCLDSNYSNGTANIIVKGGKFYGFNPAASYGEPNGPANFVAAGFHVVETVEDGMKVFEVVAD